MIRINDNGDLVCDWPDEPGEQTLATAAELKAAYAERGMVIVPREPTKAVYSPDFGDGKECVCGHPYYRHFDSYEGMAPVGCKYCECSGFRLKEAP